MKVFGQVHVSAGISAGTVGDAHPQGYCVGTLPEGYICNVPLPRVPVRQSAIPDYYEDQYGVPTYITPRSLVESAAYAFSPAWQAIAINT